MREAAFFIQYLGEDDTPVYRADPFASIEAAKREVRPIWRDVKILDQNDVVVWSRA